MSSDHATRLREIIAIELQVPVEKVHGGVSLRKNLGMDSVAALNILFAAEDAFGVRVPEGELEGVDDLEAVLALFTRHQVSDDATGPLSRAGRRS